MSDPTEYGPLDERSDDIMRRLAALLSHYDRTSSHDKHINRSMAQKRRRALDDAEEFLAKYSPTDV